MAGSSSSPTRSMMASAMRALPPGVAGWLEVRARHEFLSPVGSVKRPDELLPGWRLPVGEVVEVGVLSQVSGRFLNLGVCRRRLLAPGSVLVAVAPPPAAAPPRALARSVVRFFS